MATTLLRSHVPGVFLSPLKNFGKFSFKSFASRSLTLLTTFNASMAGGPRKAWRAPVTTNISSCEVLSHWRQCSHVHLSMKYPQTGRVVSAGPNKVLLDSAGEESGWSVL